MAGAAHVANLFVARYGLIALFFMITIEEAGVWMPVPSDVFVIFFSYRATRAAQPLLAAAALVLTVIAGVVCGSLLLYLLARRYRWLMLRFGRFLHIDEHRLESMEGWVRRHGVAAVIPVRLIPGLRVLPSAVLGMAGVPLRRFIPAVAASALIWALLMFAVGAGGSAVLVSLNFQRALTSQWILPAIILAVGLVIALELWHPWRRERPKEP